MGRAMTNILTVLLVALAAVNAVPVHFPHGKTVVYKYYADVKTGTEVPVPYASQFAIDGLLHVRHDTTDPTLKHAYYVTLTDVKFGLHNGHAMRHERVDVLHPITEPTKMIQDPFLVVYDENGKFQGVKLVENESGWSKNIKQAIASMLQLDLASMHVQTPMKPHSFVTMENTIHGVCYVSYNVRPKDPVHPEASNTFLVTKFHEPQNCTHFAQRVFNHVEHEPCHVESEQPISTSCNRVFEIEQQGQEMLIKKLTGQGSIMYTPWLGKSEGHYVFANQTLTLENVMLDSDVHLPTANFQDIPIIRDVTYNKPQGNYALHAGEDLTQGRHTVKLDVLIPKLKKMLGEAADYLKENHLDVKEPDWKHGQTVNRLLHTMNYMDLGSLEQVYNAIQDAKTQRDVTIRNIFLGIVPHVGTTAAALFTRNVIRKHKVSDLSAVQMLSKLPMHMKIPSERLLLEMEDLVKFGDSVSMEVRKASILCFSTLIHKTFANQQIKAHQTLLERYLVHFLDHVKNEPTYEMKCVYLMAIKNVRVGNIHELLAPIIRGDVVISEKPYHIRVQAIWAIRQAVAHNPEFTHNLLLPILTDTSLPLPVRVIAYDVLMSQLPNMARLMNIHKYMQEEKNEHLYNYHVTTIQGLANSVDPCMKPVQEMAKKILLLTRMRPVTSTLSTKYHIDYVDPVYGFGEAIKASWVVDELTGMTQAGYVEHFTSVGRKPVSQLGIHWSSYGLHDLMKVIQQEVIGDTIKVMTNENVKNVMNRATQDMPPEKDIHLDLCVTMNGHVIFMTHYNKNNWKKIFDDYKNWKKVITDLKLNWQHVAYEDLYEMQVPTDMGVPAIMSTRTPVLTSLRLNTALSEVPAPLNLKLEMDARVWRHGEYSMTVYNPIADVWHAVRRVTAQDVAFPVEMSIGYNHEAKSVKITVPRLPVTKLSVGGILTHAKNYVTVTEDETDVLKKNCPTCHHHEIVTKGTVHKKHYQTVVDSKDTGLQFSSSIFDCETHVTPVTRFTEWLMAFNEAHKNVGVYKNIVWMMGIRQQLMRDIISPAIGSCGNLIKIEPSILHPTSHVDMNVRINVEDLDHTHENLHVTPSKKINVRATVDATAAATNASARSWDMNVNVEMSQGHVNNNLKVQITRVTPAEKDLKICIDGQQNYPVMDTDPLNTSTKDEVNSKLTMTMGTTVNDKCVRDETVVTITMKSEMSDEQRRQMIHDNVHGACVKDIQNPLFHTTQNHVPKTWSCIQDAMRYTTMRKYTTNIVHKKVPLDMITKVLYVYDFIRSAYLPHMQYLTNHVEPGNVKIVTEYPVNTNHMDVSVITPLCEHRFVEVPVKQEHESMIWTTGMINTHFTSTFMQKYINSNVKLCTLYPQVLITADNGTMPFIVSDMWTLISGDYVDNTYAIFVKSVHGNKIATKMFVGEHEIEVVPTDAQAIVKVNGNVVDHHEKGVIVPSDEHDSYAIKLTKNYEHIVMQSTYVPVMVYCTPNSVSVLMDTSLQGVVTGMCGHMDDTHKEKIPKIYSVSHL